MRRLGALFAADKVAIAGRRAYRSIRHGRRSWSERNPQLGALAGFGYDPAESEGKSG
jgi:hypothetical protein